MTLSWVSVDALTGAIVADLPDITPQGPCAKTMGRYETLEFVLPLPKDVVDWAQDQQGPAPLAQLADWQQASRPGAGVIVALDESGQPLWGGLILTRKTDHTEAATLSTVTLEAYFDRRYVGPYNVIGRDQGLIVSDLITQFVQTGMLPGLPIRIAAAGSAHTQSVVYNDYDDKTIYSILGTMAGAQNGPQWTVDWEWSTPTTITPVLTVADRLGAAAPAIGSPNAVFSMPGPVQSFEYVEDWGAAKGANRVTATGSGSGLSRPEASLNVSDFAGRPTMEYRYAPQQPPLGTLTVAQHAAAALAALQNGTRTLTLTSALASAPILGQDWDLGDDIGIDVYAPAWIDGSLRGVVGTCVGWQRDDNTVTPVLFVQDPSLL